MRETRDPGTTPLSPGDGPGGSLRHQAASGVKWTGVATTGTTILQYAQLVVLARLLAPSDFGLMAMVMVVLNSANAFADMGVSNAVIYRQDTTRNQLSSLYWLNVGAGLAVFGLIIAIRPVVIWFYREPRLAPLLLLAGLIFVITPFGQLHTIMLRRDLLFARLALIQILSSVVGVAVAILTAVAGEGVRALIWGSLSGALANVVLVVATAPRSHRPGLHFRRRDLKGYVGFGLYQMGERSITSLASNFDYLFIGRFLGTQALGYYSIAFQLILIPVAKINPIFTQVAFPFFARKQNDDAALRRGYLELSKLVAFVAFPLLVGLAATAPVLIPVFYGTQWSPSIVLLQILVPVGILRALDNPSGAVIMAKGRVDIGFKWNLFMTGVLGVSLFLAARQGLLTVAWTYLGVSVGAFLLYRPVLKAVFGLGWREYFSSLKWPTFTALPMGVLVYVLYLLLDGSDLSSPWTLALEVGFGAVLYIGAWALLEQGYLHYVGNMALRRKPKEVQKA